MYWDLEVKDNIGELTFDHPDKPVNMLGRKPMEQLNEQLDQLEQENLDALLITSGKETNFIAGADIEELQQVEDQEKAFEVSRDGQMTFRRIEQLPYPVIALVNGACLGGGFELALACDYRIASDSNKTELGCPEVKLGIIPGWGGSQRLPRLIGLKNSIRKLLKGSSYDPDEAQKKGVVDQVINKEHMKHEARQWIQSGQFPAQSSPGWDNWRPVRWYILNKAHEETMGDTRGNMPAPLALIRAIRQGMKTDLDSALEIEAEEFAALTTSQECKNLIRVFFLRRSQKNYRYDSPEVTTPERVGVIGAGTMGSGIAHWTSSRDLEVPLIDIDENAVRDGINRIEKLFDKGIRAGAITKKDKRRSLRRIHPSTNYNSLKGCDLVIEAVLEEMEVKAKVFEQLSDFIDKDTVIASNTSALSIEEMAEHLPYPENMVGIHFFNPVFKMSLVEVVKADSTSDASTAKAVEFVKRIGKAPVVVKDRPGFLVNRILVPYLNEAGHLLDEGYKIEEIDSSLVDFGMPMGPIRLIDEVGIDVGYHVADHLAEALSHPYPLSNSFQKIFEDGLKGKKQGRGFYRGYDDDDEQPNPVYQPESPINAPDSNTIVRRLIDIMIAEAVRCLEEGIVEDANQLDIAMILGTGFAPFRGGLLCHADNYGLSRIVDELKEFREEHGPRYAVPERLSDFAKQEELFTRDD